MARKFKPFDRDTIVEELEKIDSTGRGKLFWLMAKYAKGEDAPYKIRKFDEGFSEIRHQDAKYQGRVLFFEVGDLIILVAFRKETQKTPRRLIELASQRMNDYKKKHGAK
jgi:phage-related protein